MKRSLVLIALSGILCRAKIEECQVEDCEATNVDKTCSLVYAPISDTEWGVFSTVDRPKGGPIWNYGDVVIQVPDATQELRNAIEDLAWNGQETGGQYEGKNTVQSLVPGLGMMARASSNSNLLPFVPRVDEGGLTRFDSPGVGAISHYHNYTWFVRNPLEATDEVFIGTLFRRPGAIPKQIPPSELISKDLYSTGYCLDNIRPGKSRLKDAGRGAFATRNLSAGSTISPVPLLPLASNSLQTTDTKKMAHNKQQLLRNYCLGHVNATTLLYPYGPFVNLINHFPESNVKLTWSQNSIRSLSEAIDLKHAPFLLMELVATKEIKEGDELYLNYGSQWENAWYHHKQSWKASDFHYSPSYVTEDAIQMLRTQQEQKDHEYPSNVFTSCFYRYSDREEVEKLSSQSVSADKITTFKWEMTRGLFDLKNLRPCEILQRIEDKKGRSAYAVRMLNRIGLEESEIIPNGALHIVTHVPRSAIRFSDKAGTTDQHLPNAFRHEIGLPDELFPQAWMDKIESTNPEDFSISSEA